MLFVSYDSSVPQQPHTHTCTHISMRNFVKRNHTKGRVRGRRLLRKARSVSFKVAYRDLGYMTDWRQKSWPSQVEQALRKIWLVQV